MRSFTVLFRGLQTGIIVDRYDDDEPTNACEVEWHFDGLTPDDHNDLHMTTDEDDDIIEQIHKVMQEYR